MPKGFAAIKQAAKRIEESSGDFVNVLWVKLPDDGDTATVRFLEEGDDVYSYWFHDFSKSDPQAGWRFKVPCLDQNDDGTPCPGCREDLKRGFQGLINVIWREAPVFKRDEDGRVVKKNSGEIIVEDYKDQIAVFRGGIELFGKTLAKKDVTYKGLTTRDFEIERQGTGLDTTYAIEPDDIDAKAAKLNASDTRLAKDKYDLEAVARFIDEEAFEKLIAEKQGTTTNGEVDEEDVSAFLKQDPFKE